MPAGHYELKFFRTWFAKNRDALLFAISAGIVLKLFLDFGNPARRIENFKDGPDDFLLIV